MMCSALVYSGRLAPVLSASSGWLRSGSADHVGFETDAAFSRALKGSDTIWFG